MAQHVCNGPNHNPHQHFLPVTGTHNHPNCQSTDAPTHPNISFWWMGEQKATPKNNILSTVFPCCGCTIVSRYFQLRMAQGLYVFVSCVYSTHNNLMAEKRSLSASKSQPSPQTRPPSKPKAAAPCLDHPSLTPEYFGAKDEPQIEIMSDATLRKGFKVLQEHLEPERRPEDL